MSDFSYSTATAIWNASGPSRKRYGVRVAANTRLLRAANDNFVVRFYNTPVVVIMPHGFWLNTNGRRTPSVLSRITRFTPAVIRVRDSRWYVMGTQGREYPFYDGMTLGVHGVPTDEECSKLAEGEPAVEEAVFQ